MSSWQPGAFLRELSCTKGGEREWETGRDTGSFAVQRYAVHKGAVTGKLLMGLISFALFVPFCG
jgi:hypothetical protein